jgi:predicted RNase H-like HicB family nuclease
MNGIKHDRYTCRVTWSEEDKEYVGVCAEFPSLRWLASSPETALRGIRGVVAAAVNDMQSSGEPIPDPLSSREFSGKFLVRVPPEIHRSLVIGAAGVNSVSEATALVSGR